MDALVDSIEADSTVPVDSIEPLVSAQAAHGQEWLTVRASQAVQVLPLGQEASTVARQVRRGPQYLADRWAAVLLSVVLPAVVVPPVAAMPAAVTHLTESNRS